MPFTLPLGVSTLQLATWGISALAIIGVITRPARLPEAIWAVAGAAALVTFGLLPVPAALAALGRGVDVYLFLTGMMLLSELARREGLFDHIAARAVNLAGGSASRLFALVYGVGTMVTVFLSNDATAVVLTPAVYAAAKAAQAEPLAYLLVCAFIANAASFVLPISNPANLVIFASQMPPLLSWLRHFAVPSALAIAATFIVLRGTQRAALRSPIVHGIAVPELSGPGRWAAFGIAATAVVLLGASALGLPLGWPTCAAGLATAAVVLIHKREAPWGLLRGIAWSVIPLVGGLFVLVQSLDQTGVIAALGDALRQAAVSSMVGASWAAGVGVAVASDLINNLPAGLIASSTVAVAHAPPNIVDAVLIGVDLGPNLSVTGSLATILWLVALRREGLNISAGSFLRLGLLVMPPALLLALAAAWLAG